jgi:triosephosphate isomerase
MLIVANWKAYVEDGAKAKKLFATSKKLKSTHRSDIVLAPPGPLLGMLAMNNKSSVAFAAQDVSSTTGGAKTGEVLASVYANVGATYSIVGHSERRAMGDTNTTITEKLSHALAHGLIPILCIGEHTRDSEGKYLSFIREELTTALEPLAPKDRTKIIIAYEPLWAIGKTATAAIVPADLAEMVSYIRKVLGELLSGKASARSLVLYGGSVEPENAFLLAKDSGINGFLVGHASVDVSAFSALIKNLG